MKFAINKAEFQLALDTGQCRGEFIPSLESDWKCQKNKRNDSQLRCKNTFTCKRGYKKFNRVTEITSKRQKLKSTPSAPEDSYKIIFPKIIRPTFDTGKNALLKKRKKEWELAQKEKMLRAEKRMKNFRNVRDVLPDQKDDDDGSNDLAEFLKSEGLSPDDIDQEEDIKALLKRENISDNIVLKDFDPFTQEDVRWSLKTTVAPDGQTKTYKLKRITSESLTFHREMRPYHVTFSMVEITSASDSLLSYDFAWTPMYLYSEKWNFKGILGGHLTSEVRGTDETSFVIYEGAALVQYKKNQWYYEAGFGWQLWQNSTADKFLLTTLGVGYKLEKPIFKFVDRFFLNYTLVSNDESNKEFKLGIGFRY